jgi:molybdenum cofactor cytidylyltransferase
MARAALVLAAGMARRMSGPNKMLLSFHGKPLVRWAVEAACGSSAERVVLVTGRDGDAVAEATGSCARLERVHNPAPEHGLAGSLHLGLAALEGTEEIAVLLGDMPLIDAALIDLLFSRWRAGAYALAPTHEGAMGNPVILGAAAARDCLSLRGDGGARKLLEARLNEVVLTEVGTPAIFADVDSGADLARFS